MLVTSDQLALLMKIVDENKQIKNHKTLQKIVYLSQEQSKIRIWQFKWFHFGPFSPALQTVFQTAVNYKLLKYSLKNGEININYDNELISLYLQKPLNPKEISLLRAIKTTLDKLGNNISYYPEKLELVASLYYLYQKEGDLDKAKNKLVSLKSNNLQAKEIEKMAPKIKNLLTP